MEHDACGLPVSCFMRWQGSNSLLEQVFEHHYFEQVFAPFPNSLKTLWVVHPLLEKSHRGYFLAKGTPWSLGCDSVIFQLSPLSKLEFGPRNITFWLTHPARSIRDDLQTDIQSGTY